MAAQLDLTLPATAPSVAQYQNRSMTMHPAALYTLVELSDDELQQLQEVCETECGETGNEPGSSVRLAPQPRFVGQALRAVFDHHLELGSQDTYDPTYFIVAIHKDWKKRGVLLVTLDDDELKCNVDSFRLKASDAGIIVLNLQIANSDWSEEKESYEIQSDEENDGDDDDEDNGDDDGDNEPKDESDDEDASSTRSGPPAPKKNHTLGYYIPIYRHPSLDPATVLSHLEPASQHKTRDEYACRDQGNFSVSHTSDPSTITAQAFAHHPLRCARNPFLHKHHLVILDTPDPATHGMLIGRLDWDGSVEGRSVRAVRRLGETAARDTIRVPYDCVDGLQARFITLANGDAGWPSRETRETPAFAVFQYDTGQRERGFGAKWLDPRAARRAPGEERVLYADEFVDLDEGGVELVNWDLGQAVRRFPWFCREKRFVEGMSRKYFVCVDGEDVREKGVLLVRRDWDGNIERKPDELLELEAKDSDVRKVRVPVKEALGLLEKGVKKELEGMSAEVAEFFGS